MEKSPMNPISDRVPVIQEEVIMWSIIDGFLVVAIVCGNVLTILAVRFSRKLRSLVSSLFVLSLAISDLIVGLTLPYHLAFYTGSNLGAYKTWCMLRFFLIILACSVSIWNLVAIAIDRYIAICYPLHYTRMMTKRHAITLTTTGWLIGLSYAIIPLFWNNWETANECEFDEVLHPWYIAGVITPTFTVCWISLSIAYWRIWREATKHTKHMRSTGMQDGSSDWKSVQVVIIVMGCFTVCWLPYFVVACCQMFNLLYSSATLYKAVFSLAMANSGMNPLIYAWKNTHFRKAFSSLLKCRSPDQVEQTLRHQEIRTNSAPRYPVSPTPRIIVEREFNKEEKEEINPPASLTENIQSLNNSASNITNIISGNLIINNYNVYENYLDVIKTNQNQKSPTDNNNINNNNINHNSNINNGGKI